MVCCFNLENVEFFTTYVYNVFERHLSLSCHELKNHTYCDLLNIYPFYSSCLQLPWTSRVSHVAGDAPSVPHSPRHQTAHTHRLVQISWRGNERLGFFLSILSFDPLSLLFSYRHSNKISQGSHYYIYSVIIIYIAGNSWCMLPININLALAASEKPARLVRWNFHKAVATTSFS